MAQHASPSGLDPGRRLHPHAWPSNEDEPPQPRRMWSYGGRVAWVAGLVLALSSFMGWYRGTSPEGPSLSVVGWNTGSLGKLVFFVGLAVVLLAVLRELGAELPRVVPESLLVVVLGTLGTIFVVIRIVSIPDTLAGTSDRAVGLWVALVAAVAVVVAGLARASEEL